MSGLTTSGRRVRGIMTLTGNGTLLLGSLFATEASAIPVAVDAPYLIRADRLDNDYGFSSGDFITFGNNIVSPTSGTTGFGTTTNLTTGATVSRTTSFIGSTAIPLQFGRRIPYDADLTGPWTLTYTNGTDSKSVTTPSLVGVAKAPFANSVSMSGPALTPTVTWSYPSTVNGVVFGIFNLSKLNAAGTGPDYIWNPGLPGSANSYTIPAGVLNSTDRYLIDLYGFVERNPALPLSNANTQAWSESLFGINPVGSTLPIQLPTLSGGSFKYNFSVVSGIEYFIDPEIAIGYTYKIGLGDPDFATVTLPTGIGDNLFDIYGLDSSGHWTILGHDIMGGVSFDFGPSGVDEFKVLGIEVGAMLDPTNTQAFITGLTFLGNGRFTGTQTPIVIDTSVPEPGSLPLLVGVLGGLWFVRRMSSDATAE